MPTSSQIAERVVNAIGEIRTAAEMAEAAYQAIYPIVQQDSPDPTSEISLCPPGHDLWQSNPLSFAVTWEAGPHDWALVTALAITRATGVYVDAPLGFCLNFNPANDVVTTTA